METSPFSKLLAELRNRIWLLAVSSDKNALVASTENAKQPGMTRTASRFVMKGS